MKNSRRQFMILSAAGACTLALNSKVQAQAMVSETDPQATALGYKSDATKVDKAKYAKYAAGQECDACALYQGKAGSASGGCALFAGKQVSAKGWCSAFAKKA
jgi:High potential iron-sulfur protein